MPWHGEAQARLEASGSQTRAKDLGPSGCSPSVEWAEVAP
jgi:hypothetical protein